MSADIQKLSEDFSEMKGDIKVLNSKVDGISVSVQNLTEGLGKRVQDHSEKIARFDERFGIAETERGNLYKKIQKHLDEHWRFIGIIVGFLTIVSIILKLVL